MELENPAPRRGGIIMQLNKVHSVKTIDRVAAELGATVDRVFDLAIDMETEDGVIWVYGPGDDSVIAFSPFGIENLRDLIEMDRDYGR
jgi:predicted membrane GTPase involved in stress response